MSDMEPEKPNDWPINDRERFLDEDHLLRIPHIKRRMRLLTFLAITTISRSQCSEYVG